MSENNSKLSYRHELKYICSDKAWFLLENKLRYLCKPDPYAGREGSYTIRSLYFDTCDNAYYFENKAGVDNRKKYRIRLYNGKTNRIRLECKYSKHNLKAKEGCLISEEQCRKLIQGDTDIWAEPEQELLYRFLTEKKEKLLCPKVVVEYVRIPYVYPVSNVRITLDREIRSSSDFSGFLKGSPVFRGILPEDRNVLEVKYDGFLPGTVREFLACCHRMRRDSFSKYTLCRDYGIQTVFHTGF